MSNRKSLKLVILLFFDTIAHHIINKYYKWCHIEILLSTFINTFEEAPTADPELPYVN